MKVFSLLISICLCLASLAKAQQYTASVQHYGPENGLSHREVNAIFQDKQGFMWFGTKFGLNRFDGLKFTSYTKEQNGLGFDDVEAIAQDADGYLWLVGPFGQSQITLFNPVTGKSISFAEKFGKPRPTTLFNTPQRLLGGADGTIYFTDYQPARLLSYHPRTGLRAVALPQFKKLAIFQATARHTVWAIADDSQLLELTPEGRIVHQFSHQQAVITICGGQPHAGIQFFYSVTDAGKRATEVFYSIDEAGQRHRWPVALLKSLTPFLFPVCYAFDRTGLVWDGVSLRDSTQGVVLTTTPQLPGEPITNRSFYRDRNGLFWLGTSFGVYRVKLAENHFQRLFYQESTTGKKATAIRGITVLGDRVFANLEKFGLYSSPRQGGPPKREYTAPVVSPNKNGFALAYGLAPDGTGGLYAGISDYLVHYAPATGPTSAVALPGSADVWALHRLGPQQWVLGGREGLLRLAGERMQPTAYTQYNQFGELAQAHILHIAPDRQGTLWVCANTGLYTLDPQRGITARYWRGGRGRFYLPAESYQHFYQDAQGIYWLATASDGLIRWDRPHSQYRQFRRSEGLSNDHISAVYPDARGHLWLSSDFGLMQFDPARFTTRAYFVEDGITNNEFNRIAHFQEANGRLYFGGLNGITAFDPADFQAQPPPAELPLRITSFRQYTSSGDQTVDKTEEVVATHRIVLEPDNRFSVLDFALLNYTNPEKNVYAYQIRGLDTNWTYQAEPTLRLSNLPYGDHELVLKAQTVAGQWSTNTLVINLVVLRPFYLRPWFLVVAALALGAGIWAWMRWRSGQLLAEQLRLQTLVQQATTRIEHDKEIIEQQAQDLLRLNEARSRFFTNISHEFRTPLTVILGMAAELEASPPEDRAAQLRQATGLIKRNGTSLLRLVNQILDLSKIEAGELHLHPEQADLTDFFRYLGESFQSLARARHIELHIQEAEESCLADFDQDKLQEILANLLANALKFTPAGGHVYYQLRCHASWQPLPAAEYYEELSPPEPLAGPWLQFRVRDTGPGIKPASLPRIFDRFYQADNQADAAVSGTGIGLALVRELVLLMRGGLAVRSQPGGGAEFVVSLRHTQLAPPAAALARTPELAASPYPLPGPEPGGPLANGEAPLLLLVEDNPDVAAYVQACLGADYRLLWAENGQQGIDLALAQLPDLIVSDVMMPVKNGLELCDTLKGNEQTTHIPIVLLTARAAVDDRLAGLRHGADAYLVKPFLREELRLVLANLAQSRRALQVHYTQLALGTPPSLAPTPPAPETAPEASLEDAFLAKLRTTVEGQLGNAALSVDTICQLLGLSRTTLHKKLTALTGMSISRYLRALRLRKAQELLATSELPVASVAYAVGFEDPKYFSRVFSEEFGCAPSEYRLSTQK